MCNIQQQSCTSIELATYISLTYNYLLSQKIVCNDTTAKNIMYILTCLLFNFGTKKIKASYTRCNLASPVGNNTNRQIRPLAFSWSKNKESIPNHRVPSDWPQPKVNRKSKEAERHGHTIDPVLGGLEVVGSPVPLADNGGDLRRVWVEDDPLSIAAADEEVKYKGGQEEDKGEEGPSLGHGDRRERGD